MLDKELEAIHRQLNIEARQIHRNMGLEGWAERIMDAITPEGIQPERKGRLFGPRSEKFPV